MKKLSLFYSLLFLITLGFITSCGSEEDDPTPITPDECASETFPSTTGSATVNILNYTNMSGGFTNIDVAAGDVISLAIEVIKGTNRPQKLRVYQTDCENVVGDIVTFSGQDTEDNGTRFDLRNTDDPQIRNVNYTVPTGMPTIYLNIEIDESGGDYSYKRVKLNVSGSGIIETYTNRVLGGNTNPAASRMSTGTGLTYTACNAAANINYIDVTYAVSISAQESYLASNPARFSSPINLTASSASCGEDGTLPTDGGKATYFKVASDQNLFDNATDSDLTNLSVSSSDPQYVKISNVGQVFEFLNSDGKKGLVKVVGGTLNDYAGSITVDVKVQR